MNKYYLQKVTAAEPLGGCRLRVTFADGFTAEIDLAPLLECGPIFEPLRDPQFFAALRVVRGSIEWSDELDLSSGSLRAWCEAGRFLDYDETNAWIEQHGELRERTQSVA